MNKPNKRYTFRFGEIDDCPQAEEVIVESIKPTLLRAKTAPERFMDALLADPSEWAVHVQSQLGPKGVMWERPKLWSAYEIWCHDEGENADKKKFFQFLRADGLYKEVKVNGKMFFRRS